MDYSKGTIKKCQCGHEMFNIATNGRFARCSKCGTIYNKDGQEVKIGSVSGFGTVDFFTRNGEIEPPKIIDYRGSYLDSGIEEC